MDIVGGDGAEVTWEGHTDGHRPGTTETVHLAPKNTSNAFWADRTCVQLLVPQPR